MPAETGADFEIAHVLMMDVVEYSKLLIDDQRAINRELTSIVRGTRQFQAAESAGKLIRLPTGDGMTLIFFTRPDDPVRCAMEIAHNLRNHIHVRLRMGIHSGPVSSVTDVNDRSNLAGAGINVAQRVMSLGESGHILLSHRVADDLAQYREWQPLLHDLGECEVKHGGQVHIYNLFDGEIGNPSRPEKCRPIAAKPVSSATTRPGRLQRAVLAGICLFWVALISASNFAPKIPWLSSISRAQLNFENLLEQVGRKTATRADFVFLGIDDATLGVSQWSPEQLGQRKNERAFQLMTEHEFPWSRELWALLLDRLVKAGARLVIFDVLFNVPRDGDEACRVALERYRDNVVIGWNAEWEGEGPATKINPVASLVPPPQPQDDRVGYLFFVPDPIDGKVHSVQYTLTNLQLARKGSPGFGKPYESIGARTLAKLAHADDVPRDLKPHQIRFTERGAYQSYPLWEMFDLDLWHSKYADGGFFEDKLVIVGAASRIMESLDVVDTPVDPKMPGSVVHLNAIAAVLDHEFLRHTPLWLILIGIIVAGILAVILLLLIQRRLLCLIALIAIGAVYLVAALLVYNVWGLFLPVVHTLAAFLLVGVSGLAFRYALERRRGVEIR